MSWELALAIIGGVVGLSGLYYNSVNRKRTQEQDVRKEEEVKRENAVALARIEGKVDTINRGFEDMRVETRVHNERLAKLEQRIVVLEQKCKHMETTEEA